MSQLTITLSDAVLQAAQDYAHRHGQALDAWVAQLVAEATQATVRPVADAPQLPTPTVEQRLASVRKLAGSLKAPADFDYKKELEEGLAEKYGL
ncbi:MAG: hypothetical protein EOO56_24035 [Hymenobacter sp.]|nr:MAG: hypothetical protein EOO56_24035 [Hymenobacter sp.]